MNLAPALLEVEHHVGRRLAGGSTDDFELKAAFGRARGFLAHSDHLFSQVQETLLTDELGEQKLLLASQEMQHTRVCLDRLEEACLAGRLLILEDRLQAYLTSARQCLGLFSEFAGQAGQQAIYSPSQPFDAFIKAGIKHLEGRLPQPLLEARLVDLGGQLARFERIVGLLPRLHRVEPTLQTALEKALIGLQTGFGALAQWQRSGDRVALQDALRLLGSASTILVEKLRLAEEQAAAEPRFSAFRPLEEWLRLRELATLSQAAAGEIPSIWIQATVMDFFRAWDYLLARASELAVNPHLAQPGDGQSAGRLVGQQALRARLHQEFEHAPPSDWLQLPLQRWTELVTPLEQLQSDMLAGHKQAEEAMAPFQELPGLEAMATLKEQVMRGQADPSLLKLELERQLARVEELIDGLVDARDPISAEFRELLPVHRSAFLGMLDNLQRQDWKGLEALWQGVLTTLPHLVSLSKQIARRMARQSSSAQRITCLRCSHANAPERRVCSSCGANLPAVVARAQSVAEVGLGGEMTSGGAGLGTLGAIELLEELVRAVETNRVGRPHLGLAINGLLEDIDKVRKTFGGKVIPLIGQDPTLDLYLRFFAQAMGVYTASLKKMQEFADGASLAQLHTSLAECRETLSILEELKARIDEALRG